MSNELMKSDIMKVLGRAYAIIRQGYTMVAPAADKANQPISNFIANTDKCDRHSLYAAILASGFSWSMSIPHMRQIFHYVQGVEYNKFGKNNMMSFETSKRISAKDAELLMFNCLDANNAQNHKRIIEQQTARQLATLLLLVDQSAASTTESEKAPDGNGAETKTTDEESNSQSEGKGKGPDAVFAGVY